MKNQSQVIGIGLCALLLGANVNLSAAPVIFSSGGNGVLVCGNLVPGSVAAVEWASSLAGPWHTNWAGLDAVTVGTNGSIQVSVPMFYRVRGVASGSGSATNGMALIPPGSFTMGDTMDGGWPSDDNIPPVTVNVSAFYMDTYLVSYSQWQMVYTYATNHGYGFDNAGAAKAADHPVTEVIWYDVVKWSNARSQQAGLTPVYYTDAGFTHVYTNGDTDAVYPNWSANGYRLPTEAEWEKAARGGLSGQRFPWGDTISWGQANYMADPLSLDPSGYAYDLATAIGDDPVYNDGVQPYTSPVGSFVPNGYGLYDMAGNIFVWCWDWWASPPYPTGSPYLGGTDPRGPASGVRSTRVWRGGAWANPVYQCRSANRADEGPDYLGNNIGFRCVLPAGQ